jgi:hypothetical protein
VTTSDWANVTTVPGRGKRVARVVVEIYETGDPAPYMLFDDEMPSVEQAALAVARARDALAEWR